MTYKPVDLARALGRAALGLDGDAREPDGPDLGDPVARNHDVHRPLGRRTGPVDERDAAQDQAIERPLAFGRRTIGRRADLLRGRHGQDDRGQKGRQGQWVGASAHG
jgi:hypothetical protein